MDITRHPSIQEFISAELANHQSMVREAIGKGRDDEMPDAPTLDTAADSLDQMPNDSIEDITRMEANKFRALFAALIVERGQHTALVSLAL